MATEDFLCPGPILETHKAATSAMWKMLVKYGRATADHVLCLVIRYLLHSCLAWERSVSRDTSLDAHPYLETPVNARFDTTNAGKKASHARFRDILMHDPHLARLPAATLADL